MKPTVCCFCGQEFYGFGNNPWPANSDVNARCCDHCNMTVVLPARIKQMTEKQSGTEQSKQR